jgi:hypothetical protein
MILKKEGLRMGRALAIFVMRNRGKLLLLIFIILLVLIYTRIGLYTIQPMGVVPGGSTLVIWRDPGKPFFDSPDAACLRSEGSVTLLCRGSTISAALNGPSILSLPFWNWAYLQSTGGMTINY